MLLESLSRLIDSDRVLYRRNDHRQVLNLASNVLVHPGPTTLFRDWLSKQAGLDVSSYPWEFELEQLLAGQHKVPPEQVLVTAGADAAIKHLLIALKGCASSVIVLEPNYSGYDDYPFCLSLSKVSVWGGVVELQEQVRQQPPSLVVLTLPNGITGQTLSLSIMSELIADAGQQGHLVLIDATYAAFAGQQWSQLLTAHDNLIIIESFSKSMGLAGLRCAVLLGPAVVVRAVRQLNPASSLSTPALGFVQEMLHRPELVQGLIQETLTQRERMRSAVPALLPGWRCPPSQANFICLYHSEPSAPRRLKEALAEQNIRIRIFDREPGLVGLARISVPDERRVTVLLSALQQIRGRLT